MGRSTGPLGLFAVLGVFILENQCGLGSADRQQLAVHFLDEGQYQRSLVEAHRAARQDRGASEPHLLAALALLGLGKTEEAIASLVRAIERAPQEPRLYETLRRVAVEQKRIDLARAAFQELATDRPGNALARAGLGWARLAQGEVEPALELLEEATRGDSAVAVEGRLFVRLELARACMTIERYGEATEVLREAAALDSMDARPPLALGECRLRQGDADAAEADFERAMSLASAPGATAAHIAQILHEAQERTRAIAYYERALTFAPVGPLILNNLAWAFAEEHRDLDRAESLSLAAVKAEADNAGYLDTYAEVLYQRGQPRRALAVMRRALELAGEEGDDLPYLREQLAKFRLASGLPALPAARPPARPDSLL